jgi:hypothetical protein
MTRGDLAEEALWLPAIDDFFADFRALGSISCVGRITAATVIDANRRCVGLNQSFLSLGIFQDKPCVGQSVDKIFGAASGRIEKGLCDVVRSGSPVFDVELPGRWETSRKRWVADLFPIRFGRRNVSQLGIAVSQTISMKGADGCCSRKAARLN